MLHFLSIILTPDRRQSKTLILFRNVDKKLLETEFLMGICRQSGDKWQSKTLFQAFFDPHSSIVKSVFNCRLSDVILEKHFQNKISASLHSVMLLAIFNFDFISRAKIK